MSTLPESQSESRTVPSPEEEYQQLIVGKNGGEFYISKKYIGGGAFGSVYQGTEKSTGKPVAIKVIRPKGLTKSQVDIIRSEIAVLVKLSKFPKCYPYITCFYDYRATSDYTHFVVMELVSGGTLHGVKRQNIQKAFLEIVQGLNHIHSHGIVHRDIKPDNILLTEEGQVKIADLGVGCAAVDEIPSIRNCAGMNGTPLYIDPLFFANGEKKITHSTFKSDIFALGQTMYAILFESYPPIFYKKSETEMKSLYEEATRKVLELHDLDFLFRRTIIRMMNPLDADARPSTSDILQTFNKYDGGSRVIEDKINLKLDEVGLVLSQAKILQKEDNHSEEKSVYVDRAISIVKTKGVEISEKAVKAEVLKQWSLSESTQEVDYDEET